MGRDRITGHTGIYVDQVLRRERFQRANPSVEILSPRQLGGREWVATWDEERGSTTITRLELRSILDVLEERFGIKGDETEGTETQDRHQEIQVKPDKE